MAPSDCLGYRTFFIAAAAAFGQTGAAGPYIQNPWLALVTPLLGGRKVVFPLPFNPQASLDHMRDLLAKQAFKPLIDRTFPLGQIQDAFKLTLSGEKIGNVMVSMD